MKTPRRVLGRRSGLTLIEVLIASAILAVLMGLALMVMLTASSTASEATITSDLENRGRQALERVRNQFMTGRFRDIDNEVNGLGLHLNNTFFWYQVPVNVQDNGNTSYGATAALGLNEEGGRGKSLVLRFEAETVIRESSAAPTTAQSAAGPALNLPPLPQPPLLFSQDTIRNLDINRDGDLLDTFVRGKIKQYVLKEDLTVETSTVFADNVLLAVASSGVFNGDFDGNPATPADQDFLFRYVDADGATVPGQWPPEGQGRAIAVTFWFGGYANSGKSFHARRTSEVIRLKNRQY